ncbi:hypothetical protein EDB92DRAFT_1891820 [Lactarius akahatsu]|uniref:Uncharacterized protein n=1 Tax=Lactarius akahatsu TaxID=416441 RepID=A0AAD4L7G7_9AGAM|nr:hypothetical protein EDB92DRAFT_1891820 [Lactarius akahatsu]
MWQHVIKCRLCPTERFKNWEYFCRHCRDSEEHPAEINCCERCGIYFGRQDSMKRHYHSATKACCGTTPEEAAWRKYRAKQLLGAFQARVEYCLRTREELGPTFATIARVELPSKSKKAFSMRKNKLEGNRSQILMVSTIPVSIWFRFFVCILYCATICAVDAKVDA